jgi:fructose-1-phosphate kinase PfkB-like protein
MTKSGEPANGLKFAVAQDVIEAELELEDWIKRVFKSNDELTIALARIRDSYCQSTVLRLKDNDEILAQVDAALRNAAKTQGAVWR